MESTVQEMAEVLRSTETMANPLRQRVQERLGRPVAYAEILAVMEKTPVKSLSTTAEIVGFNGHKGAPKDRGDK
jgi:hypothetical protein